MSQHLPRLGQQFTRRTAALVASAATLALASVAVGAGAAHAASVSTWEKVAQCESSGDWSLDTGNGYYGGLQFSLSTWDAYGGTAYAAYPNDASEKDQILTAQKVLAAQGQGAWPTCGPAAGLGADDANPYPASTGESGIGVWRPSDNTFYLSDSKTSGTTNASQVFGSSSSGMIPITGDWDGSGQTGIGMYDPSNSTFYLHDGDKSGGENDYTLHFGTGGSGELPIVGDWTGNGVDTVGVWNPTNHTIYEATSNTDATTALTQVFGGAGMVPVAGDWDGSGKSGFGMYDPSTSTFYLHDGDKSGGENDYTLHFGSGGTGEEPIVGDWTGNGVDTVGVYNPANETFYYADSNSDSDTLASQNFGTGGDEPVTGDWNGQ